MLVKFLNESIVILWDNLRECYLCDFFKVLSIDRRW